jgi:hypothetical protein
MKYDNQLLEKAFALGFMITREGFNGECGYETCAPSRLEADHGDETIEEFIADIEKNHVYRSLRDAAIEYLNKPNMPLPILLNHDHTKPPIGLVESIDGSLFVRFHDDMKITREMAFLIFGDTGFRILEATEENGVMLIRRAQILCWNLASPSKNVD